MIDRLFRLAGCKYAVSERQLDETVPVRRRKSLSLSLSLSPSVCPLDPLPSTGKSNLRIAQLSRETWSHARQEEFFQQEDQKSQRMQCPVQL